MSQEITAATFDSVLATSELPVLVDFWAPWCGPCRALGPTLEQVAAEHADKVAVYKCNVDDEGDLAMRFSVVSIPTLILFKGGQPVLTMMGNQSKAALESQLLAAL
ncbi:MAG: thioredoxin [Atopobiaceae bacterium]|nr:thioredoxin [Atopobiaceae bacterium]MCR4869798.1 thioredoxin [Atopobiaceae bacterium]